ncbi:hypothetical protein NUM3379_14840 [Kineococcus sp. NUM-3379]
MQVLGALGGCAVLATLALLLPGLRSPLNLLCGAAGVVLVVAGLLRHRPERSRPWVLLAVVLSCALASNVLTALAGAHTAAAVAFTTAAQLAAMALVPIVIMTPVPDGNWRRVSADTLIAAAGAGLLAVQVALMLHAFHEPGLPWGLLVAPAFDVYALAMVVHVFCSRRSLESSAVLGLSGAVTFLLYDLAVTVGGHRLALPGDPVQALSAAGALLFGLAALAPDMHHLGGTPPGQRVRSASARLLAALPAFATAPALWALGLLGFLPSVSEVLVVPAGYVLAGAGLAMALVSLRRAERTAELDPLTNLVNRRGLLPAVEELRRRLGGEPLHLCIVDLDDFKQVNDSRGHEVGDRLLVEVGARLRSAVGARGVVSRTGGDEFLVVVAEASGGWGAGDLVLSALDPPFDCAGVPTSVTASVGVVVLPAGTPPARVLADADVAMYAAKQAGKGRALTYRPELRSRVLGDFERQRELRALLDGADPEEVGRLVVLYQPIVGLEPLRVTGAEALVRWEHPRLGLLGPDSFLALAEGAGLGARLDEQVMQQAAGRLAGWDAEGMPRLSLNLNLGIGSMRRPNLHRTVAGLVERHGLTPDRFHLEITEHDELPVEPGSTSAFEALAAGGFQISLDDFGVGYTSLTYLRRFPVSVVKLDRSLTSLTGEAGRVPLMEGIAALCRALDVALLAEGVEDEAQIPALRALGVQYAQGFHFAQPLTAEEFADLVRRAERGESPVARAALPAAVPSPAVPSLVPSATVPSPVLPRLLPRVVPLPAGAPVPCALAAVPPQRHEREQGDTTRGPEHPAPVATLGAEPVDGS